VEYLKSVRLAVCASRSVAGRRLVERENPSACATVDCVNERQHCIACVSVIMTECVTN
jgi:hypothetical protein